MLTIRPPAFNCLSRFAGAFSAAADTSILSKGAKSGKPI
jgi:hypothetical protein